jgi:hypothetical protein
MSVLWKLLAVLLLTMPPAAYVAGVVVGPPETSVTGDDRSAADDTAPADRSPREPGRRGEAPRESRTTAGEDAGSSVAPRPPRVTPRSDAREQTGPTSERAGARRPESGDQQVGAARRPGDREPDLVVEPPEEAPADQPTDDVTLVPDEPEEPSDGYDEPQTPQDPLTVLPDEEGWQDW